jgi:hypothetical protein
VKRSISKAVLGSLVLLALRANACGGSDDSAPTGTTGGSTSDVDASAGTGGTAGTRGNGGSGGSGGTTPDGGGADGADASSGVDASTGGIDAAGDVDSDASVCMTPSPGNCGLVGQCCEIDNECCGLDCRPNGTCGTGPECAVAGETCAADSDCCSFNCNSTTCASDTTGCDPVGEACTTKDACCSDRCARADGQDCSVGSNCRCARGTTCLAAGDLCTSDAQCCNGYCDRPGEVAVGRCASLGLCQVVGEPCRTAGTAGACCSGLCLDSDGLGVPTCQALGGCLDCCSVRNENGNLVTGACQQNGTTSDGRPIMRCASALSCLSAGEVCVSGASSNCCPPGGGSIGCEMSLAGVRRCFGGTSECVLPGQTCTPGGTACCTDTFANIRCQDAAGNTTCCLSNGDPCSSADICCGGACVPDAVGVLRCSPGGS